MSLNYTWRNSLKLVAIFKILGIIDDAFRLKMFPYSRDCTKYWLNSLNPISVATWNNLAEKFLAKYLPFIHNAKMRNKITSFQQGGRIFIWCMRNTHITVESMSIPCHTNLHTIGDFYNDRVPSSRNMLVASSS